MKHTSCNAPTTRYTCRGSVRGACGIQHRSLGAAARCCDMDYRAVQCCHGPSAYSDRYVTRADGTELDDAEREELLAIEQSISDERHD